MKAFRAADFIKLTSSLEGVVKLQAELKSCMTDVPCEPSSPDQLSDQRFVCDRLLRACNHWAAESSCHEHLQSLVPLVELTSRGFCVSSPQRTPFYLEKILFHLLKNVCAHESSHPICIQLSDLLYFYLNDCPSEQQNSGDFTAVAKSSFVCLWKVAGEWEQKQSASPYNRESLHLRLHAARFLMLVEMSTSHADSPITILRHVKYATLAFDAKGKCCSQSDGLFLSECLENLLIKPLQAHQKLTHPWTCSLVEMTLERLRVLCKSSCFRQAKEVIQQATRCLNRSTGCCQSALTLLNLTVEMHEWMKASQIVKHLMQMAQSIDKVCSLGDGWQCQALSECCQFTVSCLDGHFKHASDLVKQEADVVLGLAKFLEAHFKLLERQVSVVPDDGCSQLRSLKQQQFCGLQQFTNVACSFLQNCKDIKTAELQLLLGACKDVVSRMLISIRGPSAQESTEFFNVTASCVHNMAYWFYSQKKYKEASDLVSPLCERLAAGPGGEPQLAVEKVHRCFKLHVESCRKAGHTALGLAAVTLWLRALRSQVSQHVAEPVAQWVRLKIDGARNGDEDLRLHTLKDGLADYPMDPELMVSLLSEELRGYKSVHGDTGQERYNTICDLLELCAEDSSLAHHRPAFLLELAQVLCYHDYSGQTECTALDAVQDCLRLLDSTSQVAESQECLLDIKAQALLWQYICTLEANMREGLEEQHRKEKLATQPGWTGIDYEPNDLNYEDKLHDDQSARDGICFTLAGEAGPMKGLDEALALWKDLLSSSEVPSLNSSEQTVFSLHLLGSLFRLMGKPLQAIQSFLLVRHLCSSLGDNIWAAGALCHLTKVLFYLESPTYAKVTLQEAEAALQRADSSSEIYVLTDFCCQLLQSHLCRVTNQIEKGVQLLVNLLQHPSLQKSSKAWYLLKVQILQELSMFLRLPPSVLLPDLYKQLQSHGWHNSETALTEAHKLLRSIVLLLLGNDVLSTSKATSDSRFVDNGENLLQKWQVLADLLSCSQDLISTLSRLGSVSEAKSFCLEGLRLAKTLHSMRHCADFLVRKAELETLRAEPQQCEDDLQYVVFLMESCTDFSAKSQQKEVKIKVSKGKRPNKKGKTPEFTPSPTDDFLKGVQFQFVETRDLTKHPGSPTVVPSSVKSLPQFVSHTIECTCPLCSDLILSLLSARWQVAQAENDPQCQALLRSALKRCQSITVRFTKRLNGLLNSKDGDLGIADELTAQVYQNIVSLSRPPNLPEGVLEDGLRFVSSRPANFPKYWMASLLLVKALDSIYKLATKYGGCISDLFVQVWGWKPQQEGKKATGVKGNITCYSALNSKRKGSNKNSVDLNDIFSQEESDSSLSSVLAKAQTPLRRDRSTSQSKPVISTVAKKSSVTVYSEEFPQPELEPRAPRRRKTRPVIKVDFSDSDLEMPDDTDNDPTWNGKKSMEHAKPGTRGRASSKSSVALVVSESDEDDLTTKSRSKKGRGTAKKVPKQSSSPAMQRRRPQGKVDNAPVEILRSIEEEPESLDLSIDELRASDTEDAKPSKGCKGQKSSKKEKVAECEILRRDTGGDLHGWASGTRQRETDTNIFNFSRLLSSLPDTFSVSDLDSVFTLLHEALESVAHFPPSALYSKLCQLLALCSGGQDPYMTALLVNESVAVTLRHQLLSEIHRKLRKLKKEGLGDLTDKLQYLSLDDHKDPRVQYLSQLEGLFQFPKQSIQAHSFKEQIQQIPANTAVCILTLADSQTRNPGDALLLCRLESGNAPVTVQIPTAQLKMPLSSALQEFDEIQKQQKAVNNLTDKKEWWEGRTALDNRMKALIQSLDEQVLGCWKGLLSPPCSTSALEEEAKGLSKALTLYGWRRTETALLKAILGGCRHLTQQHIHFLVQGFCTSKTEQAEELLQKAVDRLKLKMEPTEGHLVLILDKHLQKLPWESMPCLLTRSVTRLPSLHFLLNYGLLKKHQPQSTLVHGVDPKKTFYVLNPQSNLPGTEERFRDWFKNEPGWKGVIRSAPKSDEVQYALTKQDLYIYVGHGAGAHFLDAQTLQRLDCNAVVLLFGCSSAALAVRGDLEGAGIVLKYLMAGCPLVVGNLWDVTDREIDRYTVAFLQGWLKAGPGASLLKYLSESRQAPKLKYIIGAAPVAFGLPVALQ
ncbi:separin isoform X1 [Eleutherodactylus coqui]|uniref:separin isoform X1 n=1 Tax=Eleutherodactylus coqui TaxID=57060 RepID=UPI003461DFC4